MQLKEVSQKLQKVGIKKGDTIMIHGDAGVAAMLQTSKRNKINMLFDQIKKFIGKEGTILIPSYSYSACNKKTFDINKSPSDLGLFSESFRKRSDVSRTLHPIFSFSIYGKKKNFFKNAKIETCFGKDSIFDFFKKVNGKIICLGCSFNRVTFIHHVEETYGVNYRYFKIFRGSIKNKKKKYLVKVNFFVRNLNKKSSLNLDRLYKYLQKNKLIKEIDFGRYKMNAIASKLLFNTTIKKLKKDQKFLTNN